MRERGGVVTLLRRQHCSSLCSQSEGDDFLGGLRGLKAQQVASPIISGQARAESPTSPEPRATPWVPCPHSLRPVRAKVKANRSPILLPLQGVGVYALIPRALPWAMNWLPFQGARGAGPKRFSRRVRGPHFASKVSYSAAPQSCAPRKLLLRRPSPIIKIRCPAWLIYIRCVLRPSMLKNTYSLVGLL